MGQNFYIICYEGLVYANEELYTTAVAKGERTFIKMLTSNAVTGKSVLGELVYLLTGEQRLSCDAYRPVMQDFDDAFTHLNLITHNDIEQIKKQCSAAFPGALVITAPRYAIPEVFKHRQAVFFKVSDYKDAKKYAMLPKMAAVKVCGRLYVALNAVNVRVERPIVITVDN